MIKRLYERYDVLVEEKVIEKKTPLYIQNNLKHTLREYQNNAIARFIYCMNNSEKQNHLLFHMATGSGKTDIMAACIIDLYKRGYRNFIFCVNSTPIIQKTKQNLINWMSEKYLFREEININGQIIQIREVSNFESANEDNINILFSTLAGLHSHINNPKENEFSLEELEDKKIVIISDEAHHVNADTKKTTKKEVEHQKTWESTINNIFNANPNNIMLEFTATLDTDNVNVQQKYNDKIIFNYQLKQFRRDGYSKEVKTIGGHLDPIDRALQAVVVSQYKKKIFAHNGQYVKPVILMKSKTIKESQEVMQEFINRIHNLSVEDINLIKNSKHDDKDVVKKCFNYIEKNNIELENLVEEIKEDFSEDKILIYNSKEDKDKKVILVNSLENNNNNIRVIFSVDCLNEGWDVLNLFDIVRLYDTKARATDKTTVSEAQLIGRGARYWPFKLNEDQELYKRKYDTDLDNEMRICEELHYHCTHEPKYIWEIQRALEHIGLRDSNRKEVKLKLKDSFKQTDFYQKGQILLNKREEYNPSIHKEFEIPKLHKYELLSNETVENELFTEFDKIKRIKNSSQIYDISSWDEKIIMKAMNKISFYNFKNLSWYFPSILNYKGFRDRLIETYVEVSGPEERIKNLNVDDKLEITVNVLSNISNHILENVQVYRGSQSFKMHAIKDVFKNKSMYLNIDENSDKEFGKSCMRADVPSEYYIDLREEDWHAYEDNYGTSEEKFFVKYMKTKIDKLKETYDDVYLLRNEMFFKIYDFEEGRAFAPDYVLFLKDEVEEYNYQFFIEPKGGDRISNDDSKWKDKFLSQIDRKEILAENYKFRIIGMPLYNKTITEYKFNKKIDNIFVCR